MGVINEKRCKMGPTIIKHIHSYFLLYITENIYKNEYLYILL